MKITNVLILFMLCFLSCKNRQGENEQKFDKAKWAIKEGREYPYRAGMLKDLIANQTLKGIKKDTLISLLGQPTRTDSSYLFYTVDQQFFANTFPLHTKTLVIKLAEDSTVEWRKIHE